MKKILFALFIFPSSAWASFQPVNGSTVNIQNVIQPIATTSTSTVITSTYSINVNVTNTHAVTQSGTWTVQPGNTQNTTPWQTISTATVVTSTYSLSTQGSLSNNGATSSSNRTATLIGVVQTDYANGSAYTQGRDVAPNIDTVGNLWVSQQPAMRPSSYYASSASSTYTTATDIACIAGNATNTVVVRRITLSCTQTTAGMVTFSVIRRSSANSGGTSASMSFGKDDSSFSVNSSTPIVYSAAPTKGTFDSLIDVQTIGCMASATASPNDILIENWIDKAKVLRGTSQQICVSLSAPTDGAGTTVTGGTAYIRFEWNETKTVTP